MDRVTEQLAGYLSREVRRLDQRGSALGSRACSRAGALAGSRSNAGDVSIVL